MQLKNTSLVLTTIYFLGQWIALMLTSVVTYSGAQQGGPDILYGIIIAFALIILLVKYKLMKIWRAWYTLAILLSITITFSVLINPVYALLIAILFTATKVVHKTPITHNLTELFVYPGLAILFTPHFNVLSISLLLILKMLFKKFFLRLQ